MPRSRRWTRGIAADESHRSGRLVAAWAALATGHVKFPLQVRNVSTDPIYGPITIRVVTVNDVAAQPSR
jgi:hypothetical protein